MMRSNVTEAPESFRSCSCAPASGVEIGAPIYIANVAPANSTGQSPLSNH